MTRRQQFYDPIIADPGADPPPFVLPPLRGLMPDAPGLYLYAPDVVAMIQRLAGTYHDSDERALLMYVASLFADVIVPDEGPVAVAEPEPEPEPVAERCPDLYEGTLQCQGAAGHEGIHHYVAADGRLVNWSDAAVPPPEPPPPDAVVTIPPADPTIARIEVFPNEDGTYWYARPVNSEGFIQAGMAQGVSRAQVEADVLARWPGVPVYEVPDAMGDSLWDEQVSSFGWNGRRRPSPRRLFP